MSVHAGSAKTRMLPPPGSPEPESEAYGPVFFVALWLGGLVFKQLIAKYMANRHLA